MSLRPNTALLFSFIYLWDRTLSGSTSDFGRRCTFKSLDKESMGTDTQKILFCLGVEKLQSRLGQSVNRAIGFRQKDMCRSLIYVQPPEVLVSFTATHSCSFTTNYHLNITNSSVMIKQLFNKLYVVKNYRYFPR